jgi:hypothetical protein
MNPEVIVALLSLAGTAMGAFGGVMASAKLTNFRLEQLEKKVDEHNSFGKRIPVIEEQIKVMTHRVSDLERGA